MSMHSFAKWNTCAVNDSPTLYSHVKRWKATGNKSIRRPVFLEIIGMNIRNLEINILFFICDSLNGQSEDGIAMVKDVFEDFSDIPEGELLSAINAMENEGLITINPSRACLSITEKGISRLHSSIACRVHNFDACHCGRTF
jgi:hypothetical protein